MLKVFIIYENKLYLKDNSLRISKQLLFTTMFRMTKGNVRIDSFILKM